jgi:Na+-driven multidrug efflux pump
MGVMWLCMQKRILSTLLCGSAKVARQNIQKCHNLTDMRKFSSAPKLVAFNTGILYIRMLISTGVAFFSTRLVLDYLGKADYGIYALIGGVVGMLSYLNMAMAASTYRFMSYHQGKNDFSMQKKIFSTSFLLHLLIGAVILLLLETGSLFLFNGFLKIPPERIPVAKTIYHISTASICLSILSVPFGASLNARENILWPSIVNIIETLLKLFLVFSLAFFIQSERLVMYSIFMAGISLLSLLLCVGYCLKNYAECRVIDFRMADRPLIKEMGAYAGWNMFGTLSALGRYEGLTVVLNLFLGTVANAAFGIANQVMASIGFFSEMLLSAISPQIMKSEGANDRERMLRISMIASKFGFFLLAFLAIPCIFEMPALLGFWLKQVPEYTVVFCSFMLLSVMINQLTAGLGSAVSAVGNIRNFTIMVAVARLLILPCAYLLLRFDCSPTLVFVGYASLELIAGCVRLILVGQITGLSIKTYFRRVFLRGFFPVFFSVSLCLLTVNLFAFDFRFILTFAVSVTAFVLSAYYMGLYDDEKTIVNDMLKSICKIIKSKRSDVKLEIRR